MSGCARLLPVLALSRRSASRSCATGRARRRRRRALRCSSTTPTASPRGRTCAWQACAPGSSRRCASTRAGCSRRSSSSSPSAASGTCASDVTVRDPAAVADRRVLHRLRPRQEPRAARRGRHDPGQPELVGRPARPGGRTSCAGPIASASRSCCPQLGQGLAGRGEDLNETIRRANPALREVNKVLRVLAQQRRTIRDLYTRRGHDLQPGRRSAGATSAVRRGGARHHARVRQRGGQRGRPVPPAADLPRRAAAHAGGAGGHRRGAATRAREPARLGPPAGGAAAHHGDFSTASRPSVRALAALARSGEGNLERSLPNLKRLTSADAPPARDRRQPRDHPQPPQRPRVRRRARPALARRRAATPGSSRSCASSGCGSQTSNWFDKDSYLLKNAQYGDEVCGKYADAETVKQTPRRCRAWLGPNQPGITSADPTKGGHRSAAERRSSEADASQAKSGGAAAKSAGAGDEPLLDFLLR